MNSKAVALAALAISVSACTTETAAPTDVAPVQTERQFLEGVPADTPYAVGAVSPAPLAQILPWLRTLDDAATPTPERLAELLADSESKPMRRVALALLAELSGHFTADGLRGLGFSAEPRGVVYGIGVLPALRLEIEDPKKVREFLSRVEERAGTKHSKLKDGGDEYWAIPTIRKDRYVVLAVQGNMLLAGVTTADGEPTFVKQLLGNAQPTESLTDNELRAAAKAWGLKDYSVGFVDLARLVQIQVDPQPGLNGEIWRTFYSDREVSSVCRDEATKLAAYAPRVVFGSESWSPSTLSFGMGIEVRSDLAQALVAAKTGAPLGLTTTDDAVGIAGFGFNVGTVVDVLRLKASVVKEDPFQCEWFSGLNKGAKAIASRWAIVPPMVAKVDGGTLLVRDLRPTGAFDEDPRQSNLDVDALAAFSTEAPVELFDFVKAFNNGTYELKIEPTGSPVALGETGGFAKLQSPRAFAPAGALAVTSGDWPAAMLTADGLARQTAPFLFLRYDGDKIAEQLRLDDSDRAFRHALRGTAALQLEPTSQGFHFRSTYARQTATDATE